MKKNIVLFMLTIISLSLVGYIIYDKSNDTKKVDTNENDDYDIEDFTRIIKDELGYLISKDSYDKLTNKDKTHLLYYSLKDTVNLTTNKLENIRKNSSLREMDVEYTDIYDSYVTYVLSEDVARTLDKQTGKYSDYLTGHGGLSIWNKSFLKDFKIDDDQYILTYKYVFAKSQGDGPTNLDMYYNYEDAVNSSNRVKEFEIGNSMLTNHQSLMREFEDYAEYNYKTFKTKLDTYNYVFEIHDGNIVLVDFYRN